MRILVADDHPFARAGIAAVVARAGLDVCGEASTGEDAVAQFDTLLPDVVLMDLQMPGLGGIGAIEQIRARHPRACVLVLTTFDRDDDIERALRAGARGYLLKDVTPDELTGAIRDVHAGKTRIASAIAAKLVHEPQVQLTRREVTVLRLLATGMGNRDIAAELAIAEGTVKAHLTNLFDKLGAANRTEAILVAAKRGLVRLQ